MTYRHIRLVVIEGSKDWVEFTIKRSLPDGKKELAPGNFISVYTDEDKIRNMVINESHNKDRPDVKVFYNGESQETRK